MTLNLCKETSFVLQIMTIYVDKIMKLLKLCI